MKKMNYCLAIDRDVHKKLKKEAEKQDRTLAYLIRKAIDKYLEDIE